MKAINTFLYESSRGELYCDMDGVLTDWDGAFMKIAGGLSADEFTEKYGEGKMWALINSKGVDWWANMKWMSDGKQLWQYIKEYKPIILSKPSLHKNCLIGKRKWIERELGSKQPFILERDKSKYASKGSILIDDQVNNVYPWKQRGGIGILHKNADETIGRLKNILR